MVDIAAAARAKLEYHKKQIIELEAFLRVYDDLAKGVDGKVVIGDAVSAEIVRGNETHQQPVDNVDKPRGRRRSTIKPDAVADLMARIIREVGHPMTRGEIVAAFERRDVEIPYDDKARYIGTIAWRHKARFENIEGRGYWLRGEPLPPTKEQNQLEL